MKKVDSLTGEIIKPSETVYTDIIISNSLLSEDAEISFVSLFLPLMFFIPLLFSLLPSFSNWKKIVKNTAQLLFSTWFAYNSYLIVFTIGRPLIAGWVLTVVSILFFVLCLVECIPMKHNKFNNLRSLGCAARARFKGVMCLKGD